MDRQYKLHNIVSAMTGDIYTKDEVNGIVGNITESVYTKDEVNSLTNLKANASDVYPKTEVYNKTEVDELLANGTGGSNVVANPVLDGGEDILESIQIEDVKYSLQGQDMTFSENSVAGAKPLKTIRIADDNWSVDKGSVVTPNVELTGTEEVLSSVDIDGTAFTLKGEEMTFSESATDGATILKTIQLGTDYWSTGYAELLARIESLEARIAKLEGGN